MKIEIHSSFARDSKKLPNNIKEEIANAISLMSEAKTFLDIPNVKDMKGGKKAKMPTECALMITGFVFILKTKPLNW
jgi:mRNA-degrading endonuclease RelE of RelBE toxin-antitoxin system